jgi:hypothetical protein
LFAAYENLINSLCRTLLEAVAKSRAKAGALKPGIRLFLIHDELNSLKDSGRAKMWKTTGPQVVAALTSRMAKEINMSLFPDDGSYMKSSQVKLFCEVFDLGDPAKILRTIWPKIDTIVDRRNGIAHGRLTPDEVGRNYTHNEVTALIQEWSDSWISFLDWVESSCKGTSFYMAKTR